MKRTLSLLLCAALLLAFAACGKAEPANTEETTSQAETTALEETTAPEETETTGEEESTTEAAGEEKSTTVPDETTQDGGVTTTNAPTSTAAAKIPQTKEELVAYFNRVSDQVKIDKPGFTWTQQTFVKDIASSSNAIEWAAGAAMRFVPLEVLEMPSAAKGADHNEQFNVRGQSWSSRLAPSMVSSAKLTDKGATWELRVDLKPEKRNDLPKTESDHDHGKVFTVMAYKTIHDVLDPYAWLATMESFVPSYHDSWAILTIDKETDRLLKAEYMLTYDVAARAKFAVIPAFDATATISMHEIYQIG